MTNSHSDWLMALCVSLLTDRISPLTRRREADGKDPRSRCFPARDLLIVTEQSNTHTSGVRRCNVSTLSNVT
jgi:hypothetical protein